jgi:hypothetical protein
VSPSGRGNEKEGKDMAASISSEEFQRKYFVSDSDMLSIVLEYVENQGSDDAFEDHLIEVVERAGLVDPNE